MTEVSRKILESYQVRKSKKQKLAFYELLKSHYPQLQTQAGGFPKSRNLLLGDPEKARILLSAHYDTCARLPFPNFVTPKRPAISVGYGLLIAIPFIIVLVLLNVLAAVLFVNPMVNYWVSLLTYLVFLWLILCGPANRNNANDNTSGVVTLLEIYEELTPQEKENVCLIFFDNEEKGLMGSGYFRKKYKKQIPNKLLLNFDCVGDGEHILLGVSKKAQREYMAKLPQYYPQEDGMQVLVEKLNKLYYPSDQAGFPMAVAVAALRKKKGIGYYMNRIHTGRDTICKEENISYLKKHTLELIRRENNTSLS